MRLHRSILSAALLASLCCLSVSAQSKFTVGTASAAHGEKSSGTLEVPAGVDAATSIPVVIVNGAKPGKVLALVSGAHGTEYVSIIAIENSSPPSTPRKSLARSSSFRLSTFSRSNKKFRTSIPSTTRA